MDNKYIDSRNPPYEWLKAYETPLFKSKEKTMMNKVFPIYPFLMRCHFRLVQVACVPWNVVYDMSVMIGVTWIEMKTGILNQLALINDERKPVIEVESIQDIALSYTPVADFHRFGCIDKPEDAPFDVIADNSILFIHQVKRKDVWLFTDTSR